MERAMRPEPAVDGAAILCLDRRRRRARGRRLAGGLVQLVALVALCACTGLKITEETPASVSIRYDGLFVTEADAAAAAQASCAQHGKNAELRDTTVKAALDRFAHFSCVDR
jgi:hypothetical protein